MPSTVPHFAFAVRARTALAALAAAALLPACSDPAGPRDDALPPGVYVLRTIDGTPLPSGASGTGTTVVAETLFVVSATRYAISGRYQQRVARDFYAMRDTADFGVDAGSGRPTLVGAGGSLPVAVSMATPDSIVVTAGTSATLVYHASPAPPPAGPVASLQLSTTDTAVVLGGRIDIRPFVVRGLDATGRWIAAPSVTLVPPAGWTLDAGVLVAPSHDDVGTARLVSGDAGVDVRVDAVPDLRASRWSLTWSCVEPSVQNAPHLGDSATYAMTVDSARYVPTEGPPYPAYPFMDQGYPYSEPWGQAALYARGTRTLWSGGAATTSEWVRVFNVVSQRADAVSIVPPDPDRDVSGPPAPGIRLERTTDAARTYVAAPASVAIGNDTFCRILSYRHASPVRLTELPPS